MRLARLQLCNRAIGIIARVLAQTRTALLGIRVDSAAHRLSKKRSPSTAILPRRPAHMGEMAKNSKRGRRMGGVRKKFPGVTPLSIPPHRGRGVLSRVRSRHTSHSHCLPNSRPCPARRATGRPPVQWCGGIWAACSPAPARS